MALLSLFAQHLWLLVSCCFVLGLLLGSFLNVVILRTPQMMAAAWRAEARDILELEAIDTPQLTLAHPRRSEERRVGKESRSRWCTEDSETRSRHGTSQHR